MFCLFLLCLNIGQRNLLKPAWRGRICVKTTHFKKSSTTSFPFLFSFRSPIHKASAILFWSQSTQGQTSCELSISNCSEHFDSKVFWNALCFLTAMIPCDSIQCYLALSTAFIVLHKVRAVYCSAFDSLVLLLSVTFSAAEGPLHCSRSDHEKCCCRDIKYHKSL